MFTLRHELHVCHSNGMDRIFGPLNTNPSLFTVNLVLLVKSCTKEPFPYSGLELFINSPESVAPCSFVIGYLHPGFDLDEVSTRSYEITIPGLYMGLNGAYIKEKFPEFYPIWIEGHRNCLAKIAYPTSIL